MNGTIKSSLLSASLLTFVAGMQSASAEVLPTFVEIGHSVEFIDSVAASRFAKIDLDGDGLQDLVFVGTSGSPILFAVGKRADGSLGFKMAKAIVDDGAMARVLAWRSAGINHILTISANGKVRDYSGWPLVEQRSFSVATQVLTAVVGDLDNDDNDDLLVADNEFLYAYSLLNGFPKWNYLISGIRDLAVAQLDADPALEIIVGGPLPGIVLDGATRAIDWQYIDGFGTQLATGSLLMDGGIQWVGAGGWRPFTVFRASPWSPLWTGPGHETGAIATANLDNNGLDVVLQGDAQWGQVHILDSNTHQQRFQIPNDGFGVNAVAGVDFDGDGKDEIAFAGYIAYQGDPLLTVASGQSGLVSWQFFPINGPFLATALGDVDGDGRMELVAATSGGPFLNGTIAIFDAESGSQEWRSPLDLNNSDDPFHIAVTKIELVPHVGNPGMDIVFAGRAGYDDGRITVMDGVTHTARLQIGHFDSGPMRSRVLKDLALVDFDNDGVLDYVAATETRYTAATGVLLQVFSGTTGETLWTSVPMGNGPVTMNGVLVADGLNGSGSKQLIAVLSGSLRSYDSSTGLLLWTIAAANDGATLVTSGENGAEIGVFLNSGAVTFYSLSTQAYIRSYSLPGPLRAVYALGGDLHTLVAASADVLSLFDGESGSILAATGYVGQFPEIGSRISAARSAGTSWTIASGTEAALYRFRLHLDDVIFANSFETP